MRSVSELSNGNGMGGTSDSSDTGDSTAPPPLKLISLSYDQSSISNSKPVRSRKRQSAIRNGGGECRFDGAVEADRLLKGMGPPATPSGCISSAPASPLYGPASGSLRLPTIPNGIFPDFYANNGGKSRSGDDAPQHRISVGYRSENDLISSTSRSSSDSLMSGSSNCRSVVYDYGSV